MSETEKQAENRWRARLHSKSSRRFVAVVLIGLVFLGGYGLGSGQISLPSRGGVVSKDLPATLDYNSVNDLYQTIRENYNGKLTETQLLNGIKHGLAEATGDPYTTYFTAKEAETFESDLNNTFSGIGAELGKDKEDNIQVIAPIAGTPAEKAGVKARDLIATINGKSTVGMTIDEAVKNIRGKAGTQVKLQLVRGDTPVELTITRQNIQVPSVTYKTLDSGLGYIRVSTFSNDTGKLIREAAEKLQSSKGIVLDMRNNPGGSVEAAVAVSSQWLPDGTLIMQEKRGSEVLERYESIGPGSLRDKPTVVLINGGSASASEIVAAALKDNKRATVIGEKSYGKGVVQQLINLKDGGELKVTIASWYRPNGQNINKQGIKPDQESKLSDDDAAAGNDTQLKAAETFLNK